MPAVVVTGPQAGSVRWVKPRTPTSSGRQRQLPGQKMEKKSLAERKAQKDRQRMVHAIDRIKSALVAADPPELEVSVRLAIVFGTKQTNDTAHYTWDECMPRPESLTPERDVRRMLEFERIELAGTNDAGGDVGPDDLGPDAPDAPDELNDEELDGNPYNARRNEALKSWTVFDVLGSDLGAARRAYLWARVLPVLLRRMTPGNGMPEHVPTCWMEAQRACDLVGVDHQAFLAQAAAELPDPKSWAKEEAELSAKVEKREAKKSKPKKQSAVKAA